MSDERYLRQQTVAGVGRAGQARIAAGVVGLEGRGLDAEIAALYLAGAGVGSLQLDSSLVAACRALNSTISVQASLQASTQPEILRVAIGDRSFSPSEGDPVARGSAAARWALARLLSTEVQP